MDVVLRPTKISLDGQFFCPWLLSYEGYRASFNADLGALEIAGIIQERGGSNEEILAFSIVAGSTSIEAHLAMRADQMLSLKGDYENIDEHFLVALAGYSNISLFAPLDDMKLEAIYHKTDSNSWSLLYSRRVGPSTSSFSASGLAEVSDEKYEVQSNVKTNILPRFEDFTLKGYFERQTGKISLEGLCNGESHVQVLGFVSAVSGDVSVSTSLHGLGNQNARVTYSMKGDDQRNFSLDHNGQRYTGSLSLPATGFEAVITTPWSSYGHLRLFHLFIRNDELLKLDTFVEVDRQTVFIAHSHFKPSSTDFHLKIEAVPYNHSLELVYGIIDESNFRAAFKYNEWAKAGVLLRNDHLGQRLATASLRVPYVLLSTEADFEWTHAKGGSFKASIDYGDRKIHESRASVTVEDLAAIAFNLTSVSPTLSKDELTFQSWAKLDKATKSVQFLFAHGPFTLVNAASTFQMTADSFNGEMRVMSSFKGFELVVVGAKYNIAAEPTAAIHVEVNGVSNYINTKMNLKNVFPTITVLTSFKGFEKLVLSGSYFKTNSKVELDLTVEQNGDKTFIMTNTIKLSEDFWSHFEVVSNVVAPIVNLQAFEFEFGWKRLIDLSAFKVKWTRGKLRYYIAGKVSKEEFELSAATPFVGYETVALSGKLGATSIGQELGLRFEQNAVRRDVSIAFETDEASNVNTVRVRTPFDQFKSIKVRLPSMMMADMGMQQMDFGFENQGTDNDFAMGIKYDFSRGLSNGLVLLKAMLSSDQRYEAKVVYNNVDGDLENGFDASVYARSNEDTIFSAKASSHQNRELELDIQLAVLHPFTFQFKSDFSSTPKLFVAFEQGPGSLMSLDVSHDGGSGSYKVQLKTPLAGYEIISATIVTKETRCIVTVFRNKEKISTFTIDVELPMVEPILRLNFKWEATPRLWAEISVRGDPETAEMSLKAPNKNWKASTEYRDDGTTSVYVLNAVIDDDTLSYSSERVWTSGSIVSKSKFLTTLDFFETKQEETSYSIKYSLDFSSPWEIVYESKWNGDVRLALKLNLDVAMYEHIKVEGFFNCPSMPEGRDVHIKISIENEMKPSTHIITMVGKFNDKQADLKYTNTGDQLSIELTSNIRGLESIVAVAKLSISKMGGLIDYSLEVRKAKFISGKIAWNFGVLDIRLKVDVQLEDSLLQEVEVKWSWIASGNEISGISLQINTQGFETFGMDAKVVRNNGMVNVDLSTKSAALFVFEDGGCCLVVKAAIKCTEESFGVKLMLKAGGSIYQTKLDVSHSGKLTILAYS